MVDDHHQGTFERNLHQFTAIYLEKESEIGSQHAVDETLGKTHGSSYKRG
jgi:hypothetical protein